MLPLAAAVALLGATQVAETWLSSWILSTYPAEQELMPYAHLVDDPTSLAMARAKEVAAAIQGEVAPGDAGAIERCPKLADTHPTPRGRAERLAAPQRPDRQVRSSLDSVRAALSPNKALQEDLDALGLELARSRADAFVGDGMVHLVQTRDFGRDVLRPWLCADASGPAAATTLNCADAAKLWRRFVGLCSWGVALSLTRLSIRSGSSELCVRGLLCHALGRLWRCTVVLCTTLPLADHRCRLIHLAMTTLDEGSRASSAFASSEELAVCIEQFMRFRATVALTTAAIAVASVASVSPRSESRAGHAEQSVRQSLLQSERFHQVRGLVCAGAAGMLLIGAIGESVAMIGYTADAIGGMVMLPALWWLSGPLAKLVGDGGQTPGYVPAFPGLSTESRRPLAWLWLGCGAALAACVSPGTATGYDEVWCVPLRGWLCAAAAGEVVTTVFGAGYPDAGAKKRTE
jgi:hypothetical protein